MVTSADDDAVGAVAGSDKAKETLSQFIARVLDQLSLSAWLPSAALVLLLVFVFQLGTALDADPAPSGALDAIGAAFSAVNQSSLGAALLLVAAVVVLTMVTQAFSFEAIRALEGYWGTNPMIERFAERRCQHHRKVRNALEERLAEVTRQAWATAAAEIEEKQQAVIDHGGKVTFTPNMISALGAPVLGKQPIVRLTAKQKDRVAATDWRDFAAPDLLRRRVNLRKRLRDFPATRRILPARDLATFCVAMRTRPGALRWRRSFKRFSTNCLNR